MDYEFTPEQGGLIGDLGRKMRFVGAFSIALGVLNLIVSLLVVAGIYRDRVPAEWKAKSSAYLQQVRDKLPADVRADADKYSLANLPPDTQLWGVAVNGLAMGVFYLLMGTWTRAAGASFLTVAETQGADISHLMTGIGALRSMYTVMYTLLMVVLLMGIIGLMIAVYSAFFR